MQSDQIIGHRARSACGGPDRTNARRWPTWVLASVSDPKARLSVRARKGHSGTIVRAGGGQEFGGHRYAAGWRIGAHVDQITGGSRLSWPAEAWPASGISRAGLMISS